MHSRTTQILSIALFAALILWGGLTFILYLGVPYHGAAVSTDEAIKAVAAACPGDGLFCRGLQTIIPAISHTVGRAQPFLMYALLSLVGYAIYVVAKWFATGDRKLRIRWTPVKILLLAILSLWLMSTTLSFGTDKNNPVRIYVEPTTASFNVSPQALASLQQDYQSLLSRGCLTSIGESQTGSKLYTLNGWCIQTAFVTRVLSQLLFVLVFLFELLILGRLVLRHAFRKHSFASFLTESVVTIATGAAAGIVLLWLVAIAGVYVQSAGWILAVAIPVVGFPHARYWLEKLWRHAWEREYTWWDLSLVLGWLLISYLAINFLEVVRPFPIGWDDLGSYLNRPRLMVSYGTFIFSMSPFDWSYLTSLGFLLFGYNAPFGSTASMMINWSAGLLAVMAVYAFAKQFLGTRAGVLSALLYYALPLVGHFSFADMKIDNAIFFFCSVATLTLLLAFRKAESEEHAHHVIAHDAPMLLLLTGLFLGFAFATKNTAAMSLFALGAVMLGMAVHPAAFVGGIFFAFSAFSVLGVFSIHNILHRITGITPGPTTAMIFTLLCAGAGLLCFAYALMKRQMPLRPLLMKVLLPFVAGVFIAVFPWIEHNSIESGSIVPGFVLSSPNRLTPNTSVDTLTGDLAVDKTSPACTPTGSLEELDRYWGDEQSWLHYATLPWRAVMNIDATGYYVTTFPALLLFPLLLLLPYFWTKPARWLRWLFAGTVMMLIEWIFLANGIPWYGVSLLLGLVVALEALVIKAPDKPIKIATSVLLSLSLLLAFGMRLWQFEQQRNILEYSMGKISADGLREITIPYYDDISATVVDRYSGIPDRPYLYRVGTFISYFIPRNLEVIGANDHQLDMFNCLYAERNPKLTVDRLKKLGFNSIIFDTNTATIESDVNGSLHKKVNAFVDFVNNPEAGLQVLISDPDAGVAFVQIP